jgi:hypothetical protein
LAVGFSLAANVQMLSGALMNLLSGFISDWFGIHSPFLLLAGLGFATTAFYVRNPGVLRVESGRS